MYLRIYSGVRTPPIFLYIFSTYYYRYIQQPPYPTTISVPLIEQIQQNKVKTEENSLLHKYTKAMLLYSYYK